MLISFQKAKPTLQIINVARGGIINEDDLLNALIIIRLHVLH